MAAESLEQRVKTLENWKAEHIMDYAEHKKEDVKRHSDLVSAIQANTVAMDGAVTLYRDVVGVIRIGKGIQDFLLFITKWGVVGSISLYVADFVKTYMVS